MWSQVRVPMNTPNFNPMKNLKDVFHYRLSIMTCS